MYIRTDHNRHAQHRLTSHTVTAACEMTALSVKLSAELHPTPAHGPYIPHNYSAHVKQSRSHLRLLLCWPLSEVQSHPYSVVPQWPQMMVGCGDQKTCRVDKIIYRGAFDELCKLILPAHHHAECSDYSVQH